ncbi:dipicolinate synthase subunit DpsA [Bacillus massiliigorillae]|uniref:dipicolinate synthase subunit DpsA n=1 Tax=Bacillus massiliigorillae TaxID=1243664 RepID=UPI0003A176CB|nr:dipicolinate synthase subunit DpsA [Bacillus massiliigorillae]
MLKDLKIVLIGGDARQIEVIKTLYTLEAKLFLIGFDNISLPFDNITRLKLDEMDFSLADVILFPVPGIDINGKIEASYSNNELIISKDFLSSTKEDCLILTGVKTPFISELLSVNKRKMIALFERDDIAILNSIPTAEGALMLAIQHTTRTIHGSKVLVLGFGRIGFTIARIFSSIGANVSVMARKPAHLARIIEMGYTPITAETLLEQVSQYDVCINTIPSLVLNAEVITNMNKNSLIIDLASKPGGTDFEFANKHHIKALWPLGLPGKTAPQTAGEILAHTIIEVLKDADVYAIQK